MIIALRTMCLLISDPSTSSRRAIDVKFLSLKGIGLVYIYAIYIVRL